MPFHRHRNPWRSKPAGSSTPHLLDQPMAGPLSCLRTAPHQKEWSMQEVANGAKQLVW